MIADFFLMSAKNLRRKGLRSWLTMIGIIVSIMTIFVLASVSFGLQGAVEEQFRILGTDKFFVQPRGQIAGPGTGGAVELSIKDVEIIEKIGGVRDISYWTASSAEIKFADQTRFFSVIGIPGDKSKVFQELGAYKPSEGRLLKEGDSQSVMIGSHYKDNNLFRRPVHAGDKIEINGEKFEVEGILEPIGNPGDDRLIYMPLDKFRELFEIPNRVDMIMVQVEDEKELKIISERVKKRLDNFRDVDDKTRDFDITTPEELLESFGSILNIITSFLLAVAGISLLVGGIGIANTMYTSVLERTREIGVMKAIGAKNSDIMIIFLIESGLLGLVGGVIGVTLGIIVSKTIEYIAVEQLGTTLLQAATPAYLIVGCLAFAFLSGAISGIWPAWRASKLKPVDSLRYE